MAEVDMDLLKLDLVRAIRILTVEGLMDFNGHMSYRLPGTDHVLINSRKAGRSSLRERDIVTIDLEGRLVEGKDEPPSEYPIHTRIYCARPDVNCVAHLHPRTSTVFSIAGKPILPVFTAGAIFPRAGVPVYQDPALIHTREAGDALAKVLGSECAALMRGHGAVCVGEDILSCFTVSIWLEENAKKQLSAAPLGDPIVFSEDELRRVRAGMWKPSVIRKTWDFYLERGLAMGILDQS
jgi:L-fuculose-phosphate aldolase